jgi:MFS family permease
VKTDSGGRVGYRQALESGEFKALWVGQLVSVAGNSVAAVALTVIVYRQTSSPLLASLTFSLAFLPYLLGGALLSGMVDRVRPRRLVTSCDAASAVAAAAMAWPRMPVPALLGLLFLIGSLSSLASGARAALVRSTVSHDAYVPARSLMRIAAQVAQIGGNAGAGALLVFLTPGGALLVNATSFAFSSSLVRAVVGDHEHLGGAAGTSTLGALRGAKDVLGNSQLRRLLLLGWLAPMFSVAPEAVAAPYIAAHHGPSSMVGWWLTALPVGVITGDVLAVRLLTPERQRLWVAPAVLASFIPYLIFASSPAVPVALPILTAAGLCSFYGLGLDARVRDAAPQHLFTRTMTLNSAGLMALQGIGFTLAGATAQALGAPPTIAIAGACGIATSIILLHHDFRSLAARHSSGAAP